ncbi:MAG: NUDIX hydrolase [Acidimicrobiales bacterium]
MAGGSGWQRAGYRLWSRLPGVVRRFVVRRATPSYHVGAICVIERSDGAVLLIRNTYRQKWGFPGGFLKRGESPSEAVLREVGEEVGAQVVIDDNPMVVVDAEFRRVDVIFSGRPVDEQAVSDITPRSPEILAASWFAPDALPELQPEAVAALVQLGRAERRRLDGPDTPSS